jgi:hypothetical protein
MTAGRPRKPDSTRLAGFYFDAKTIRLFDEYLERNQLSRKSQSEIFQDAILEYMSNDFELIEIRLGLKFTEIDITQYLLNVLDVNNGNDNEDYWRVCHTCDWFRFCIDFRIDTGTRTHMTYYNSKIESGSNVNYTFDLDAVINHLIG